ncbi:MAG: prenyltransferase/squalene oxidase repeat-containing protein, partial [Candidatus Hodarchaeales archaeon]
MKKASLLLEKNIFGLVEIQKILEYVKNRECVNGGYCFYRQQEPNTSDTFYAITIRNLLENNFSASNSTVAYLKELQYLDGSYFSIIQAYYAINALVALPSSPTVDPTGYIINNFRSFDLQNLPAEISVYRKIYFLVSLVNVLKIPLSSELNDDIVDYVFMFKNQDYGFGS